MFAYKLFGFMASLSVVLASASAFAQSPSNGETVQTHLFHKKSVDPTNPGFIRVGLLGAFVLTPPTAVYENTLVTDTAAGFGGLTIGLGSSTISFETGVSLFKLAAISTRTDSDKSNHDFLLGSQYIGVPLEVKWNYIEHPLSTFYVKGGAVPLFLSKQTAGNEALASAPNATMAALGIGGTTPLSERAAFVLDISTLASLGAAKPGLPSFLAALGVGVSFDL